MNCALSGEPLEEPLISTKSGHVFEKRLILKALEQNGGVCPVTGEELKEADLVDIKGFNPPVRPRPPQATSLAALLKLFQNEWDAQILETYTLKQHLDTVRQELSHALYQYDAACRVIARLSKERDEAVAALSDTKAHMKGELDKADASDKREMDIDTEVKSEETGITPQIVNIMQARAKKLAKGRKKKAKLPPPDTLASPLTLASYGVLSSHPLHSSAASEQGITCLDLHPMQQDRVLTGGEDASVIIFNRAKKQIEQTLRKHRKRISSVAFHPTKDIIFSGSHDNTAIVWAHNDEGKFEVGHVLSVHEGPVTALSLHATGDYIVTASSDKTWGFHDLETGVCRKRVNSSDVQSGFTGVEFHPDGLILATGAEDSLVRIWDVKNQANVASFEGHDQGVTAVSFSENGYYLATADNSGVVKLWDLRKLKNFKDLNVSDKENAAVRAVSFDITGQYLGAAGGGGLVVYDTKNWEIVKTFSHHSKEVTGVRFGHDCDFVVTSSRDRTIKFYGSNK